MTDSATFLPWEATNATSYRILTLLLERFGRVIFSHDSYQLVIHFRGRRAWWRAEAPTNSKKTEKACPRYVDHDQFPLSGSEYLALGGQYVANTKEFKILTRVPE